MTMSEPHRRLPLGQTSPHEMFFDLVRRMLGKVLVDFGDDPPLHVGVERVPQVCERPRRGDNDERLHLALTNEMLHRRGDPLSEAVLLEIVPVGGFNAAAKVRAGTLKGTPWPVTALLVRRWVIVDEDALDFEIRKLLVASIAQEQCLTTVADEHEGVLGDGEPVHGMSPLTNQNFTRPRSQNIDLDQIGARGAHRPVVCAIASGGFDLDRAAWQMMKPN